LYRHRENASFDYKFRNAHSSYISGFRVKANIMNLMYYPIFIFRRLAFAATIVILYEYPEMQLALINIGTIAFMFYMIYWKPFKNKFSLYSAVCSELFFSIFTFMLYFFTVPQSDYFNLTMGWVTISTIMTSMLTSWICIGIQQVRHWRFLANLKLQKLLTKAKQPKINENSKNKNGEAEVTNNNTKIDEIPEISANKTEEFVNQIEMNKTDEQLENKAQNSSPTLQNNITELTENIQDKTNEKLRKKA